MRTTMAVTPRCERAERIYGISGNGKTLSGLPQRRPKKSRLIATNPRKSEKAGSRAIGEIRNERIAAGKRLSAPPLHLRKSACIGAFALIRGIRVNWSVSVFIGVHPWLKQGWVLIRLRSAGYGGRVVDC